MSGESGHDELVAVIAQHVRSLALVSERIGQVYASEQGLHPTDFRSLALIYEAELTGSPLTPVALAQALNLSPGAVTYSVDRLMASGHVRRERDERDGRRVVLRIAPHGHDVAVSFFGPLGRAHVDALASYTDEELRLCARFLGDLVSTLARSVPRGEPVPRG